MVVSLSNFIPCCRGHDFSFRFQYGTSPHPVPNAHILSKYTTNFNISQSFKQVRAKPTIQNSQPSLLTRYPLNPPPPPRTSLQTKHKLFLPSNHSLNQPNLPPSYPHTHPKFYSYLQPPTLNFPFFSPPASAPPRSLLRWFPSPTSRFTLLQGTIVCHTPSHPIAVK